MLPIVLAHGYLGFAQLGPLAYFNNVSALLRGAGAGEVHPAEVAPRGSLAERSAELALQIRKVVPNGKVHLIAHSMGGLDARHLIGQGNGRELIETLTTLGSPFKGTLAADIAANPRRLAGVNLTRLLAAVAEYQLKFAMHFPGSALQEGVFVANEFRDAISHLAGGDYTRIGGYLKGMFTLNDAALGELTTEKCAVLFPADCADLAGVPAYSYAGELQPYAATPLLAAPALVLEAAGQPNDGIVPLASATLPRHMGTFPVDHLGLIGWRPTGIAECYRRIMATLSA